VTDNLFILARSWKTTMLGFVALVGLVLPNVIHAIKGSGADWDVMVMGILLAAGLFCAKDGNKSTEDLELL
jgi:hypothetical protein